MNKKLQELYESKIKIYEKIINEIKEIDFELIAEFEIEFKKIDNINKTIATEPELFKQQLLKIKLYVFECG